MKILIVEDNPDMRDLLVLRVQMTGYLPIVATQGKEGIERPTQRSRTWFLMGYDDAGNGRLGSGEKTSRLSRNERHPHLPHLGNNRTLSFGGSEVVFGRRL
jgi:CheY-like chemotaxis protein